MERSLTTIISFFKPTITVERSSPEKDWGQEGEGGLQKGGSKNFFSLNRAPLSRHLIAVLLLCEIERGYTVNSTNDQMTEMK